jgi:iron complex outermembrane receptor protein
MVKQIQIIVLLIFSFSDALFSQDNSATIKGKVFSREEKINDVNVLLIRAKDSTLVKSLLCDNDGNFLFSDIKPDNYLISFLKIGYQKTFSLSVQIVTNQQIEIEPIEIRKINRQLKEVVVTSRVPYIERKIGKTVINVENSVFGLGSSGFEILQTIPGIRIDNSNQLSIQGKTNVTIYLDGKPSNLSGNDLVEFLKNMQTNNIEQIELLNTASARYDAANNGGIINIKFKKGKNIGTNGSFSIGGGLGLNYRYNSALSLNKRTEKSNFYLNYDFNQQKTLDANFLVRTVSKPNLNTVFDINNRDVKTRDNHNLLLGIDYNLKPNHSLGFLVNAFNNGMISDENNQSLIFNNNRKDSTVLSTSFEDRNIRNASFNINYSGVLNKKGANIKADIDFLNYNRKSAEELNSNYFRSNQSSYKAPLNFLNKTPSNINILSAKVDFAQPLTKNSSIDAGIKISNVSTKSDRNINIKSGQGYIFNPSVLFNYQEDIYAGYLSFKTKTDKSIFEIGLRAEHTEANGNTQVNGDLIDRSYLNLFPNISYSKTFNPNHQLTFSFNKGIARPRYEDLNPFFYFLDQYTYNQGNPALLPSFNNSTKIDWEIKEKYHLGFQYNYINDFVYTVYEQNNASNVATTSLMNFDYRQTLRFDVGIPIKILSWWNADLNTQVSYEFFRYLDPNFGLANNESSNFTTDFNQTLNIKKGLSAQINFHYESPTSYGIYVFKPLYFLNFGISKPILKQQGSLRFTVMDIFDTNANRYKSNFYNLDFIAREKAETRSFRLAFSYRFGKKEVKAYRRRTVGANDEKSRAGQ